MMIHDNDFINFGMSQKIVIYTKQMRNIVANAKWYGKFAFYSDHGFNIVLTFKHVLLNNNMIFNRPHSKIS